MWKDAAAHNICMHVRKVRMVERSCPPRLQLFARNADVDRVNDAELEALPGTAVGHAVHALRWTTLQLNCKSVVFD